MTTLGDLRNEARENHDENPRDLGLQFAGLGQAILQKLVQDDPNRIVEVHCEKGIQLRVRDVLEQTIAAARMLMDNGIGKGDAVVLYSMANEWVTPLTFACYTIGAPVNFFETKFEGDNITYTLDLLQPSAIIYEAKYRGQLFTALQQIKHAELKVILNLEADVDLSGAQDIVDTFQLPDIGDPKELAATLMLTSGTSGFPKIIQISHALMMQGVYNWWKPAPGRVLCLSSLRWISHVSLMMHPVFYGAQRMYTSSLPSGSYGRDLLDKFKVTHCVCNPSVFLTVLRAAAESNDPSSLSSLRFAMIGGEAISDSLVKLSAQVAPRCRFVKAYGMTEMSGCVASVEDTDRWDVNGGVLKSNYMAKILDDNGHCLGPNKMGRLFMKSTVPFLGYLRNVEANRETFVDDGWLNTGDCAYLDSEGLLNLVTRYSYLVRSGNTVVIPKNVEDVVDNHPSVLKSVFVGHPLKADVNDEVGTVFVVPQGPSPPENLENDLRELLSRSLQGDELRAVKFIRVIPEMPLTVCCKVDRTALKDMARDL